MLPGIANERLLELLRFYTPETGMLNRRPEASATRSEDFDEWRGFALENVQAALKSTDILFRGLRVLNFSVGGAASMTLDDGMSAARALMGCRTVLEWMDLQAELVKLNGGRLTIRALFLSVMALQMTEEAIFPLIRRANATRRFCDRALVGA